MLKFKSVRGQHLIEYGHRELIFSTLHDALEYIFYQRIIAVMTDEPIGVAQKTLYPVYRLTPPVVERMVKFYDLGAEEV